jgi:hypothetical protein
MNENGRFKVAFTLGTPRAPHASLFSAPLPNASTLGPGWERSARFFRARTSGCVASNPASPRSRFPNTPSNTLWHGSAPGGMELSSAPSLHGRVLRSLSARAAMDGRRFSTVTRTPLARGDARLVRASNTTLPAERCCCSCVRCCCSSLTTCFVFVSRARLSQSRSISPRLVHVRHARRRHGAARAGGWALFVQARSVDPYPALPHGARVCGRAARQRAQGGAADERAAGERVLPVARARSRGRAAPASCGGVGRMRRADVGWCEPGHLPSTAFL